MIKYVSNIRFRIFFLNVLLPVFCFGPFYFIFFLSGNLVFDFFLALSLGLSLIINSLLSKRKFLYYIRLSPDKLQVKYLTSYLKTQTVLIDLSRLSGFELKEKKWLTGQVGEINLRYKGIWQRYLITDKKLLLWMQENLMESEGEKG